MLPDHDILPSIECLATIPGQRVLSDLVGGVTVLLDLHGGQRQTSDAGIDRSLPEPLDGLPATHDVAIGWEHASVAGVEGRYGTSTTLAKGRRKLRVPRLDLPSSSSCQGTCAAGAQPTPDGESEGQNTSSCAHGEIPPRDGE